MKYALVFFLCGSSHGLLDMMTSGGLGVALFAPFYNERYFFPFRPVKVSPIGIDRFFSEWGLKVLWTEFLWIGVPCFLYLMILKLFKR